MLVVVHVLHVIDKNMQSIENDAHRRVYATLT